MGINNLSFKTFGAFLLSVAMLSATGCSWMGDSKHTHNGPPPVSNTKSFPADMDSAQRMLKAGNVEDAYLLLKQNRKKLMAHEGQKVTYLELFLQAAHATEQYEDFVLPSVSMGWFDYRDANYYTDTTQATLKSMLASDNPMARWAAYRIGLLSTKSVARATGAFEMVMHDPDPFIRHRAMFLVDRFFPPKVVKEMLPTLKLISTEDPEPMNRDFAVQLVRQYNLRAATETETTKETESAKE